MSKKVTIPTDGGNPFVVILGGIKYVYKPGETVDVPDGVALEIEEWERWRDKYRGAVQPPFAAGGGGVQPDLSQNDPNAADYVKNRTHYEEVEYGAIVESQTVEVDGYAELVGVKGTPEVGETYTVVFDGTSYECVAWYHADWEEAILGNGSFVEVEGNGDDVPFAIEFYSDDSGWAAYLNANDGEHTVEVVGNYVAVKQLAMKFIPNDAFTKFGFYDSNLEYKVVPQITNLHSRDVDTRMWNRMIGIICDENGNLTVLGGQYTATAIIGTTGASAYELPSIGEQKTMSYSIVEKNPLSSREVIFWLPLSITTHSPQKFSVPLRILDCDWSNGDIRLAVGNHYDENGTHYFVKYTQNFVELEGGEREYSNDATVTIINKG